MLNKDVPSALNDCHCCNETCDCEYGCSHIHNDTPAIHTAEKVRELNKAFSDMKDMGLEVEQGISHDVMVEILTSYLSLVEENEKLRKSAKEWYEDGYANGVSDGYNSTERIMKLEGELQKAKENLEEISTDLSQPRNFEQALKVIVNNRNKALKSLSKITI